MKMHNDMEKKKNEVVDYNKKQIICFLIQDGKSEKGIVFVIPNQ